MKILCVKSPSRDSNLQNFIENTKINFLKLDLHESIKK